MTTGMAHSRQRQQASLSRASTFCASGTALELLGAWDFRGNLMSLAQKSAAGPQHPSFCLRGHSASSRAPILVLHMRVTPCCPADPTQEGLLHLPKLPYPLRLRLMLLPRQGFRSLPSLCLILKSLCLLFFAQH